VPSCSIGFCVAGNGDLSLLHRFEQRRLHLRGGTVDLVGEHQIAENGAGLEFKAAVLFPIDVRAGHVGGKQIGRELHPAKLALDELAERLDRACLGDAGQSFHQHVAIGQKGHEQTLDHGFLADDGSVHRRGDVLKGFARGHLAGL
jgi:hypothetical protein